MESVPQLARRVMSILLSGMFCHLPLVMNSFLIHDSFNEHMNELMFSIFRPAPVCFTVPQIVE